MTPWLRILAFSSLLLAIVASASPAAAQDDAATLFKQGKELYGEGKYDEAYEAYKKAWDLRKSFDIAGNLGNVEIELGKHRDAVVHLRYVIDHLPASYDADKREVVLARTKERLAEALAHVALVAVAIEPEGTQITVDGENVGTTPLADELVLAEGKHTLVAKRDGYKTLTQDIDAKGGSKETLRMKLEAGEAAAGDKPPADKDPADGADDGPSIPIIIVGGVLGLGAIGAGIGLHVAASGKASEREDLAASLSDQSACSGASPPAECQQISNLTDEESTFSAAGTAMLIVGGVFVAATIVYAVWPRGGDDDDAQEASLHVLPWAGPGSGGVGISGHF